MNLNSEQAHFWQTYLSEFPPSANLDLTRVIAEMPGTPEITDELIELYLSGRKTAGSGVVEDYETAGESLPRVGDHWIALSSNGEARCILRTESVETHLFLDVPERIARAEGEGDLSLDYWRKEHSRLYAPHISDWGLADINDATVVTEFFSVVYRAS